MTGEFQALDADTGEILWSFQTPSGIVGQPVTWEKNGKQYVTVMSGIGGGSALRAAGPKLVEVPAGGASGGVCVVFEKSEDRRGWPSARSPPSLSHPPAGEQLRGVLTNEAIDQLWHYIRANAYDK